MKDKNVLGYTLIRQIEKDGLTETWYAENANGEKATVISLCHLRLAERFIEAVWSVQQLTHPNIQRVYGCYELDGRLCMVTEFLEGEDLNSRMNRGEHFTDSQLKKWWDQLASALNYMHGQGVAHLNIKPSRIFVDSQGDAKLMPDICSTKIGKPLAMKVGTLIYMSPECVSGSMRSVDGRSDSYTLAVTFVSLMQGRPPYGPRRTDEYTISKKIMKTRLPLKGIPVKWKRFLKPYLEKNPDNRPALEPFSPRKCTMWGWVLGRISWWR